MREWIRKELISMAKMFWAATLLMGGIWAFGKIIAVILN